jgi:hypothetical protein
MPIEVNPDDAVWKPLADLGNYLDETFPLVYAPRPHARGGPRV